MWNGTMFVDLDWPLNASSLLSASAALLVEKVVETASKSTQKSWHNTCSNYVPHEQADQAWQTKHHIFAPTAGACSSISPPPTLQGDRGRRAHSKSDNHFSIQRIIFHTGAKMLIIGPLTRWVNLKKAGCTGECLSPVIKIAKRKRGTN